MNETLTVDPEKYTAVYVQGPVKKSRMILIDRNCLVVESAVSVPNWWYRMWHKAFFGITWEEI